MEIENNLKIILWRMKIEQQDLAKQTGISRATISTIVNDKSVPTLYNAYKIAATLGVSVYDIWMIKEPSGE